MPIVMRSWFGRDGVAMDIPPSVYQGLRLVAQAIANGQAATVAWQNMERTTQRDVAEYRTLLQVVADSAGL